MKQEIIKISLTGAMQSKEGDIITFGKLYNGKLMYVANIEHTSKLHGYTITVVPLSKWIPIRYFQIKWLDLKRIIKNNFIYNLYIYINKHGSKS